jgi:biotin operon repressor
MGELIQGPWKTPAGRTLSKLQLATELGKSRKTIERYMAAGMPHGRTVQSHARFNLKEVLGWLDEQRTEEETG